MSNANYMDGVPVKIAEKYKPPPPIYNLPQSVLNKLNLDNDFYWKCELFSSDLQLEKKAISKIEQWKRIRQRNKEQRKERILKREHLRKQEYEEKQKNLLNNVSYPSTDDLSSEDEDEKFEQSTQSKANGAVMPDLKATSPPQTCLKQPVNSFDNILQPTVLAFNSNSTAYDSHATISKTVFENKVSNSFNYKDFEEDTSSPFDNIELKTINDLDVLAQVLHNSQIKSPADEMLNNGNVNEVDDGTEKIPCICLPEQRDCSVENIPKYNTSLPRFQNDLNSDHGVQLPLRDNNLILASATPYRADFSHSTLNGDFNNQSNSCNASEIESAICQTNKDNQSLLDDQMKSKSVPDILKELRDEIKKSEMRRYINCSFNMEHFSKPNEVSLTNESADEFNELANVDVFSQLDGNAKALVRQISAMGFPLKRVAKIVQLLGADDKKVVEHLIPLSELADLGFEENKISDALIRNENNKNKALDELIS